MDSSSVGRPTFGGLASGLDTSALLEGLLAVERLPLQRIEARRSEVDAERGLMRDLNTRLLALRNAAQKLDNRNSGGTDFSSNEEFLRYSGASSNEDIVGVSATSGAAPGDIDIIVKRLASSAREVSNPYTEVEAQSALGPGQTLTISLDNADPDAIPEPIEATEIVIEAGTGTFSLSDIRDQINTSAENNGTVRADILRASDDSLRLVLSSTGEGPENALTITGDIALDETKSQAAETALFNLFGEDIERSSNGVDDVLTGITLQLKALSEPVVEGEIGEPGEEYLVDRRAETLTVEIDNDEVAAQLEEFTKAYNDVMSFLDSQFRYDEASGQSGPLSGDSTLRRIQGQLRNFVTEQFSFANNQSNPFTNQGLGGVVSGLGIEIEEGGRLSVDREKLDEALALDALSVREFFSGRVNTQGEEDTFDSGFASLFAEELDELVRTGDGTLAERDDAYERRLRDFDVSIDRFTRRVSQREESLILRFSELERIVAGLQSQQGFLGGL